MLSIGEQRHFVPPDSGCLRSERECLLSHFSCGELPFCYRPITSRRSVDSIVDVQDASPPTPFNGEA
jgi:hypothetical protein